MKLIDYKEIRKLFDEEYKRTAELIKNGQVHLDNLAEGFTGADKVIRALPDVDAVEVKHGKWIKHKLNQKAVEEYNKMKVGKKINGNSIYWTCSCCDSWGKPIQKYCPICGAKMDKE